MRRNSICVAVTSPSVPAISLKLTSACRAQPSAGHWVDQTVRAILLLNQLQSNVVLTSAWFSNPEEVGYRCHLQEVVVPISLRSSSLR